MIRINFLRLTTIMLIALIFTSIIFAFAANIVVPNTRLTDQKSAITVNALKPPQCSALNLTAIVICTGGNCNGGKSNELMLGTASAETINGGGGTDCILGGGGDDHLNGKGGGDVCIGGPGTDIFAGCETIIQ